jgi:hypothetical protein
VAVMVLAGLVGVAAVLSSRGPYDHIGESAITFDHEAERADEGSIRDEVRTLVEARNARLIARGKPPLDVDAEVERRLLSRDG